MNLTHLHLLSNHLPIFGSVIGSFVLAYGLWSKSNHTKIAAYLVLISASAGALIANFTGEAAEEAVEHIQGISENILHQHEEAAEFALIFMSILGVLSLIGLYVTIKKSFFAKTVAIVTLLVALFSFSVVARTGYLGGQIRHTEINDNNPASIQNDLDND